MSNLNPESHSEEHDPKATHPPTASTTNPGKKKSGFQITSVTDSGHGRPVSIVRDGEESADDLDESHASYSDVSYSRTTDADHDQESTASEDTLNISMHDNANAIHGDGSISNHISAIHHGHHMHHTQPTVITQVLDASGKMRLPKDLPLEQKKTEHTVNTAITIPKTSFAKQQSEHLDSPQELPHDNISNDIPKDRNPETANKKVEASHGPSVKFLLPHSESEQNLLPPATVSSHIPTSVAVLQPITSSSTGDSTDPATIERPVILSSATVAPSGTTTTKPVSVSSAMTGIKARVYKVVKRETTQPARRSRGRWKWYDFTDTQTPLTGSSLATSSEDRALNESGSLQTFATYTNTLMSTGVVPYSASSLFIKDQLLSATLSSNSPSRHASVMDMDLRAADDLKTAIKNYAGISTKTTGDALTGDAGAAAKPPKIDNKIEAAMDLVKKHLMSAVRDEVDELKEKIKDLIAENTQLKSENKELRAAMPSDAASQVNQPPLKELSTKENQPDGNQVQNSNIAEVAITKSNASNPTEHTQKGASVLTLPQDGSASNMATTRPSDHKVTNAQQNTATQNQNQDAPKAPVDAKSTSATSQPTLAGQAHVHTPTPQIPPLSAQAQNSDTHEHGQLPAQETSKPDVKTKDVDFDKKNPP